MQNEHMCHYACYTNAEMDDRQPWPLSGGHSEEAQPKILRWQTLIFSREICLVCNSLYRHPFMNWYVCCVPHTGGHNCVSLCDPLHCTVTVTLNTYLWNSEVIVFYNPPPQFWRVNVSELHSNAFTHRVITPSASHGEGALGSRLQLVVTVSIRSTLAETILSRETSTWKCIDELVNSSLTAGRSWGAEGGWGPLISAGILLVRRRVPLLRTTWFRKRPKKLIILPRSERFSRPFFRDSLRTPSPKHWSQDAWKNGLERVEHRTKAHNI